MTHYWQLQIGNIDPAFPRKSLRDRISSEPNFERTKFRKFYFLITRASQYHYQQIPGDSLVKFLATEIQGESHPVSMCIPVTHLKTRYFTHDFSCKALIPKLPIPILEDFSTCDSIVDYYLVDLEVQRALQLQLMSLEINQ